MLAMNQIPVTPVSTAPLASRNCSLPEISAITRLPSSITVMYVARPSRWRVRTSWTSAEAAEIRVLTSRAAYTLEPSRRSR